MTISWYPGHMHKARKQLAKVAGDTDVVIELLDARAPQASSNPLLAQLRGELPCIKVLNKSDLADPGINEQWLEFFHGQSATGCLTNGLDNQLTRKQLMASCRQLVVQTNRPGKRWQALITGIPNVGKSTLLNQILARKVAKTGNEPAVTRDQQRVKLEDDWFLVDTPGMMWPRLEDQQAAYRLAMLGTIRNTAIDVEDIGWHAAEILLDQWFPLLQQRYGLDSRPAGVEQFLTTIARAHGCLVRGNHVDWYRISELLLGDLRSGRLGRLSLEIPPIGQDPSSQPLPAAAHEQSTEH